LVAVEYYEINQSQLENPLPPLGTSNSEVHGEKLSVAKRQTKDITNRLKPNTLLLKASRLIDFNFVAYLLI
jgi:hypothetical protein